MKPQTLTLVVAFIILCTQLVSLNPKVPIRQYAIGEFSAAVKKVTVVQRQVVYKASLASTVSKDKNALVFVGDVMLGRNVEYLMDREGFEYPFVGLDLSSLFTHAAVIGNFESSVAVEHTQTPAYAMKFSVQEEAVEALTKAHFSHLSLANNHSFDFGVAGYKNAQEKLREHSLVPFGNAAQLERNSISYIDTVRGTVALIGINASSAAPKEDDVKLLLQQAAKKSTFQIIFIHWGNEYELTHSKEQRFLAETLVNAGADLIIGHHPHVTQDIDLIKGVVVFYSLGNYIFDQYFSPDVQEGLVVGLDLQSQPALSLIPITTAHALSQPRAQLPEAHQQFLEDLAKRSHPSLHEKIMSGIIPLLDTVATSTKVAMM